MRTLPVLWRHGVLFAKAVDRVAAEKAMKGSAERQSGIATGFYPHWIAFAAVEKAQLSFLYRCLSAAAFLLLYLLMVRGKTTSTRTSFLLTAS